MCFFCATCFSSGSELRALSCSVQIASVALAGQNLFTGSEDHTIRVSISAQTPGCSFHDSRVPQRCAVQVWDMTTLAVIQTIDGV